MGSTPRDQSLAGPSLFDIAVDRTVTALQLIGFWLTVLFPVGYLLLLLSGRLGDGPLLSALLIAHLFVILLGHGYRPQ